MVWVLAENHYFHLANRGELECTEYLRSGRVDYLSGAFLFVEKTDKLRKVRFVELALQSFFPGFFYLNCQNTKLITSSMVCT